MNEVVSVDELAKVELVERRAFRVDLRARVMAMSGLGIGRGWRMNEPIVAVGELAKAERRAFPADGTARVMAVSAPDREVHAATPPATVDRASAAGRG